VVQIFLSKLHYQLGIALYHISQSIPIGMRTIVTCEAHFMRKVFQSLRDFSLFLKVVNLIY
jgi:hypothetical protein